MIDLFPSYADLAKASLMLIALSLILERGLSVVFEYRWYAKYFTGKGLKTPIAFALAWAICASYSFDIVQILFVQAHSTIAGIFLTAAVAAGGSKVAISLFQGVLGLSNLARTERHHAIISQAQAKTKQAEADKAESEARIVEAQARVKAVKQKTE